MWASQAVCSASLKHSDAQTEDVGEEITEFLELLNDDMSDTRMKDKSSWKNHEGHIHTLFSSMKMTAHSLSRKPAN